MKTSEKTSINKIRFLTPAIMLILFMGLLASPAMGQNRTKKGDRIPQDTLKEAKVTARIITTVQEIEPMRVRLNVLNPTGRAVRISILDYANLPVYQESFTGKEYNKILNFKSTLPGRYMLQITGLKQTEIRRFAINSIWNRNITASQMENHDPSKVMASIYKRQPTKEGQNNIILHVVNNTGKPIHYVFRNDAHEIIHRGTIRETTFSKNFNLAESPDGNYTFEVNHQSQKTANRTFTLQTVYDRSFAWTDKRGRPLKPAGSSPITLRTNN